MPSPTFIICARDIVEDKETNLVSIFSIAEQVQASREHITQPGPRLPQRRRPGEGVPPEYQEMKVMAVWKKNEGDDGEFEHEFVIEFGNQRRVMECPAFSFAGAATLHRQTLRLHGFPIPDAPGDVTFTSRIRAVGEQEWTSQSYSISVMIVDVPGQEAHDTANAEQPAG